MSCLNALFTLLSPVIFDNLLTSDMLQIGVFVFLEVFVMLTEV